MAGARNTGVARVTATTGRRAGHRLPGRGPAGTPEPVRWSEYVPAGLLA
ncbi:MAG: hypothetical protein WCF33_19610 [Pseudonocardiaceae bacterium]